MALERIGQVLCTATVLFFIDTKPQGYEPWLAWLILSALLMVLYECYWFRYFRGGRTLNDFYRPFLGVPVPGQRYPWPHFCYLVSIEECLG